MYFKNAAMNLFKWLLANVSFLGIFISYQPNTRRTARNFGIVLCIMSTYLSICSIVIGLLFVRVSDETHECITFLTDTVLWSLRLEASSSSFATSIVPAFDLIGHVIKAAHGNAHSWWCKLSSLKTCCGSATVLNAIILFL